MTDAPPLLEVKGLRMHFPISEGVLMRRQIGEVKAVDGVACLRQWVITDQASMPAFDDEWERPLLAEAWIDGDMFHVDGLMADGAVLFGWPSRYLNNQWLTHRHSAPLVSGMLPEDDPLCARLRRATADVVRALPPPMLAGLDVDLMANVLGRYRQALYPINTTIDVAACERNVAVLRDLGLIGPDIAAAPLLDLTIAGS